MTRTEPFTFNDCIRSMHEKPQGADDNFNNEGLVAIISLEHLSEEYRKPEYQLFRLSSGFGCKPTGSGRKCYGTFCFDGADDQFGKHSFIGIANEETTKIAEAMVACGTDQTVLSGQSIIGGVNSVSLAV